MSQSATNVCAIRLSKRESDVHVSAGGASFAPSSKNKEENLVTKSEFVDTVADRVEGMSRKQAADVVDAVLDTISDTLKRGSDVTFSGFGKFHVAERGAREGVNPRTGERMQIPASKVPRFTPGSGLKGAVKGT